MRRSVRRSFAPFAIGMLALVMAPMRIADRLHGYRFAQVPVYQRVNGLQLEPRYAVTLGVYHTM